MSETGNLALSLKKDECFYIISNGQSIKVKVFETHYNRCKILVVADKGKVKILRDKHLGQES